MSVLKGINFFIVSAIVKPTKTLANERGKNNQSAAHTMYIMHAAMSVFSISGPIVSMGTFLLILRRANSFFFELSSVFACMLPVQRLIISNILKGLFYSSNVCECVFIYFVILLACDLT